MKFVGVNKPINISLKKFILKGEFDLVKLGVTKSWLQLNFIEPDDVMSGLTHETSPIWRYGNIEFHFNKDVLWMIYSDYVDDLQGGDKINLDKWILNRRTNTKIADWTAELYKNVKNYRVVHLPDFEQVKLILNEEDDGVVLTFINHSEHPSRPDEYILGAIQLWSKALS